MKLRRRVFVGYRECFRLFGDFNIYNIELMRTNVLFAGSAFTKAKPKHGLLTVTRLAALRLFLLPFYYHWWICQTSSRIFIALLILYSLQLFNTFLYFSAWFPVDTFNTLEVRDRRIECTFYNDTAYSEPYWHPFKTRKRVDREKIFTVAKVER